MAESKFNPTLGELLYERCNKDAANSTERYKKVFNQDALVALCDSDALEDLKNVHKLLPVIEQLVSDGLFIFLKTKESRCWGLRPREAAGKVKGLTGDERMVYSLIEEAHESGIWIRNLKTKTGIKDGKAMDKILNKLQQQRLVKTVKNIKAPMQKTYILFHLAPSDEITGGSFYDAGDLDDSLIEDLSNLIVFHVRQRSWVDEKKHLKRESSPILIRDYADPATEGAVESRPRKKRKRETNTASQSKDIEDSVLPRKRRSYKHSHDPETETTHDQFPFPAGHEYPTAPSIHAFITSNDVIRAVKAVSLTVEEVQNVLNILVWDEKLEEMNSGYRTVRGVKFKQPGEEDDPDEAQARKRGNGFTEMPCGQCPVIDLCGTGGPVNAMNCVYFDRWLGRRISA